MTGTVSNNKVWSFMPDSLEEYDVSLNSAFVPSDAPLKVLPDPYYAPWEDLVENLVAYQLTGTFREKVKQLPQLDASKLTTLREYQRAYLIIAFICHGYVWALHQHPEENLPECLSVPFCQVSEYLGINPVTTNAACVLWNWRFLDSSTKEFSFENIATIYTYTGTTDESWFYLVSAVIEHSGSGIVKYSGITNYAALNSDIDGVISGLNGIAHTIKKLTQVIVRMTERCDPYVFYWKIRPYLAGWENMESVGLVDGVAYNGGDTFTKSNIRHVYVKKNNKIYRKYAGGSAAQSSIIQLIDIALGIKHYLTEEDFLDQNKKINSKTSQFVKPPGNPYLLKMREYMPGKHRKFLIDFEKKCIIREFVLLNTEDVAQPSTLEFSELVSYKENFASAPIAEVGHHTSTNKRFSTDKQMDLLKTYNKCVSTLKSFRDAHLTMVKNYILYPAYGHASAPALTKPLHPTPETAAELIKTVDLGSELNLESVKPDTSTTPSHQPSFSSTNGKKSDIKTYDHGLAKVLESDEVALGTGGTDALSFLSQLKDETKATRIGI